MTSVLSPESLQQIKRLDLRARMVVRGFLQGLHASPLQGFSVQFSEHRRYNRGDDPKLIDWLAYAKTDRYFVKQYEAETNLTGYLVMDLSASMATGSGDAGAMSKFEYSLCLAASLTYLMTMQQDPIGLVTFSDKLRALLPARSRRNHLGDVIASLSALQPLGPTQLGTCVEQLASMLKHESLIMVFSDLWPDPDSVGFDGNNAGSAVSPSDANDAMADAIVRSLVRLKHGGHDVIVFHVLDRQEAEFDFSGPVQFEDAETGQTITVDADAFAGEYLERLEAYRESLASGFGKHRVDYVPLHTGMPFDKALTEYLIGRRNRL
ncbi:MAG: DUF58 domain-containing protein [Planctomycetota bacterium]